MSHLVDDKMPPNGVWSGSGAKFLNFETPSVNLERVKLETSNSVHIWHLGKSHLEHDKIPQKGRGQDPRAIF